MEYNNFLKNISGTACVIGLALSTMNMNGTVVVDGSYQMPNALYSSVNDLTASNIAVGTTNCYTKDEPTRLEKEAQSLFGIMRDADSIEQKSVNDYIRSISKDTGVNFFDLC